ncbi:hypothetical protein B7494_g689 [Chlorociboria aeruginascens]|nr:hypothetical protein B7494_g689 [Chlorociboria aeruginascens]
MPAVMPFDSSTPPPSSDAVPKKRGPKTDVLEALLKRVDGLEKRLKDENKSHSPTAEGAVEEEAMNGKRKSKRPQLDTSALEESAVHSPTSPSAPSPGMVIQPDVLLDTYFTRCHGKAYHILDETTTRQRIQLNQVPSHLRDAIYGISARLSEEYTLRARTELDTDDPSIDTLQTLLLLAIAFTASGKGKKAYMMLASGLGMAMALELHRELDPKVRVTPVERETRRRLFWTCYLMDKFMASGSKRPSLIADKCIILRLPSWSLGPTALPVEGEFFQQGSNLQYHSGSGKKSQGSSGMLIDIVRILGITNRYLAAGGVKGDSHFPWHSLSNLSKIRQDLDIWASGTQDVFSSVDTLFGQPDSTTLVLSKLIYHLIHCLIYRPFLPIDLAELAGTGQHQSWQIEATNLCFLHANAIAELVELGKQSTSIEWPAFVGYCICTAGTVHVHGAHYNGGRQGEVFSASADFLSREMQQLSELRYAWSSVQHQRETLQTIYNCHSDLVKSLASNPMRYSPVFHLEDFFDRYRDLGKSFDGAHLSFADIVAASPDSYMGHDLYAPRNTMANEGEPSTGTKRKASSSRKKLESQQPLTNGHSKPLHSNGTRRSSRPSDPNHALLQPSMADPISFDNNMPNLSATPFSPPYTYSNVNLPGQEESFDPMFDMPNMGGNFNFADPTQGMTPGARSNNGSTGTGGTGGAEEKDPFLRYNHQQHSPTSTSHSYIFRMDLKRKDTTKGPPLRILSLDGGGVRGYSMLIIIQELMHRTYVEIEGKAPRRDQIPKPCDHFDLICGTGTGGLIAIMLGRLRLDLETCKEVYVRMTRKVFETDKTIAGIPYRSTLFKASKLEEAIKECVREHTIFEKEGNDGEEPEGLNQQSPISPIQRGPQRHTSNASVASFSARSPSSYQSRPFMAARWGNANALLYDSRENRTKTFVTAIYKGTPMGGGPAILRSYDSRKEPSPEFNCTIWEAGRATSATGLAFKPIQIGQSVFIDEGAGQYNPAPFVLDEACVNEWPGREVGLVVSIGTGKRPEGSDNNQHLWYEGFMGDFAEARRRLISKIEGCEKTHQYMLREGLMKRNVNVENYYRLNVEIGVGEFGMNEWNRLADISTGTRRYLGKSEVQRMNLEAAAKLAKIHRAKLRFEGTAKTIGAAGGYKDLADVPEAYPMAVELPADMPPQPTHSPPPRPSYESGHHDNLEVPHQRQTPTISPRSSSDTQNLTQNADFQDGDRLVIHSPTPDQYRTAGGKDIIAITSKDEQPRTKEPRTVPPIANSIPTALVLNPGSVGATMGRVEPPPLPPKTPIPGGDLKGRSRPPIPPPYPIDDMPPPPVNMARKPEYSDR